MTLVKFLGTIEINDTDHYGMIHLRLALDLVDAIKKRVPEDEIKEKVRNIIILCSEDMFEDMTIIHDWDAKEVQYADELLGHCIEVATGELLEIARRRVKHEVCRTQLKVTDLKVASILAYAIYTDRMVCKMLKRMFLEEHGAMNFNP